MKTKYCFAPLLVVVLAQPLFAACIGNMLFEYLKNPHAAVGSGTALDNTQLAVVKIVAVHTDKKPYGGWHTTGPLDLSKIESTGKHLPATFSVPFERRSTLADGLLFMEDCQTWDEIVPKPGERLLAFFQPERKGWAVPELPAHGVVLDISKMSPATRKEVQPLFRTRL